MSTFTDELLSLILSSSAHKIMRHIYVLAQIVIIIVLVLLTYYILEGNGNITIEQDSIANYLWIPSSIMQSIAAIYGVFIAVFVLSLQHNDKDILSVGDLLKLLFMIVSCIAVTSIFFNGLILFTLNVYTSIEPSKIETLIIISLASLILSLIAIGYSSLRILSAVAGLKTNNDALNSIKQINENKDNWSMIPEHEQDKIIGYAIELLNNSKFHTRFEAVKFFGIVKDKRAVEPLINKLNDPYTLIRRHSARALGKIGDERAIEPLTKNLRDSDPNVRIDIEKAIEAIRNFFPLIE